MGEGKKNYEIAMGSVFEELGCDAPEELLARAKLLDQVSSLIEASGLSQKEVALKLGAAQPKISALTSGKLSIFSTDILLKYLSLLGCEVEIKVKKPRKPSIFRRKGKIAVS